MDFHEALRLTMERHNLRTTHIASAAGVSENAVKKYVAGGFPGYAPLMALRKAYPDFAALIDGDKAVA